MFTFIKKRKSIAVLMIGGALICFLITIISYCYIRHFVTHAVKTRGTVVDNIRDHNGYFSPVFTFYDGSGVIHKIYANNPSDRPTYIVGKSIDILYPPNAPEDAIIDDWRSTWTIPIATGIICIGYLPIGIILLYWPTIVHRFKRIVKRRGQGSG